MALVTSSFYDTTQKCNLVCEDSTTSNCRPFTTDYKEVGDWFTAKAKSTSYIGNSACKATYESGIRSVEMLFTSGNSWASVMPPSNTVSASHIRKDAAVMIVFLSTSDDQYYSDAQHGICHY